MQLPKLLITLAWSVMLSHVPITLWAQDLPALGTQAVNLDGQPVAIDTTFTGGFSVDTTIFQSDGTIASQQSVTIKGTMTVDPTHVGKTADLIVYLNYGLLDQPLSPETSTLLIGMGLNIQPWNSDVTSLIPFIKQVQLQATQPVDIFNGSLSESRVQIFFGYMLEDGTLVTNKLPISVTVETVPEAVNWESATTVESDEEVRIDTTPLNLAEDESGRLVGWTGLRWPVGNTLKVAFDFSELAYPTYLPAVCYNGMPRSACEEAIASSVIRVANTWSQYGNLYFRRVSLWKDADIRISFGERGSYSKGLGTQLRNVSQNQHTMNLAIRGFLDSPSWSKATILHEFGHAIGLAHEHNSPRVAYTWNEAQVIADFQRTQGWDEAAIRHNVLNNLLKSAPISAFFTTKFDPRSIMIYSISKRWVSAADLADPNRCPDAATTRSYCVASNTELSELDKQGIAQFYPKGASGNGCSTIYDPSSYRPGTSQWDGHTGKIAFFNSTSSKVRVTLYRPDTPAWSFATWDLPAGINAWLYYDSRPFNISMDWGIQVNNSPICIVKTVSAWNSSYFQASTTRIPGM